MVGRAWKRRKRNAARRSRAHANTPPPLPRKPPHSVRLYDTPAAALDHRGGGLPSTVNLLHPSITLGQPGGEHVYSFCFFPGWSSLDAAAAGAEATTTTTTTTAHPCCLATASRGQPARLWDCLTGEIRATYAASSSVAPEGGGATDAVAAPLALAFSPDGRALAAGFPRGDLVLFDTSRPSGTGGSEAAWWRCRPHRRRKVKRRRRRRRQGQGQEEDDDGDEEDELAAAGSSSAAGACATGLRLPGPIGCVAFSSGEQGGGGGGGGGHVLAAGSYGGAVGVFDVRAGGRRAAVVDGGGGGDEDNQDDPRHDPLFSLSLPLAFGRPQHRHNRKPPRITADASAVLRTSGGTATTTLTPVLAIAPGGGRAGQSGGAGVTQLAFAPSSSLLFVGFRGASPASARLEGWDLRALREPALAAASTGGPAVELWRRGGQDRPALGDRQQRIQFGLDSEGRRVATGSGLRDGLARVFDLRGRGAPAGGGAEAAKTLFLARQGTVVNAVAFCPADASLLAVAAGGRPYPMAPSSGGGSSSGGGGEDEDDGEDGGGGSGGDSGDPEEDGGGAGGGEAPPLQLPRASLALWRWEQTGGSED
jgi:hypothetical protein